MSRTPTSALLTVLQRVGRRAPPLPIPPGARVVTVVAGCPCRPDGAISPCQWRRAAWAATLYHDGEATHFIASGGRAYTPHAEGEALAAALRALGVPPERITLETQALHTDQNMGYSLAIARTLGFDALLVVSDPGHAETMCRMAWRWGVPCAPRPVVRERLAPLLERAPPGLKVPGLPRDQWIAEHPEPRMATAGRSPSVGHYLRIWVKDLVRGPQPPVPDTPEPTLGARP